MGADLHVLHEQPLPFDDGQQRAGRLLAYVVQRLTHGGQAGEALRRLREVVEADDGEVGGHGEAACPCGVDGAERPSDGTVIRYNISENDGTNAGCPASGTPTHGTGVFHFVGNIPNLSGSSVAVPLIYNNSIYVNKSGLNTPILYSRRGGASPGPSPSATTRSSTTAPAATSRPAPAPSTPTTSSTTVSAAAAPNIGAYNGTGGNLVSNVGFETGSMSPWVNSGAAPSVTSSNARTGSYALTTQAAGSGANQNLTGLSPNATSLLTGWAKVANAGETLAIGVKNTGGTGAGYCDDLAVEALPSANAVTNPGFETGALTPWTQSTGTASGVVASNARTGTYSLQTGGERQRRHPDGERSQQPIFFATGASTTSAGVYCYKNAGAAAGYCDDYTLIKLP
jgi:hypothetical protein